MKKRFLFVILALAVLLCSCERTFSDSQDSTEQTTESATVQDTAEDLLYQNIECFEPDGYNLQRFSFSDSNLALVLTFPDEWILFQNSDGSYTVKRDGKVIGLLEHRIFDSDEWTSVKKVDTRTESDLTTSSYIEKKGTGEDLQFRCRYCYEYPDGTASREIMLSVDYAEVNDFTGKKLWISPMLSKLATDPQLGLLSDVKKNDILLLGNSFIASSNIGGILKEMMRNNGKATNVTAISRGYATVATYINDDSMMQSIQGGAYDVVFICGFYSASEVTNLGILKNACDASDTKLVIFPAHNESAGVISSACSQYKSLTFLDWKGEIDALIARGVSGSSMYVNDTHKHSTPLAGYVGAQMIYRALYGEIPTEEMIASISQDYIESELGIYVKKGEIQLIDMDKVLLFD